MSLPRFAARVDSSPVLRVELRWPPKELSPNSRVHWARKGQVVKMVRREAGWITKLAMSDGGVTRAQVCGWVVNQCLAMRWTFHPPRSGRFDRDNAIARCKAVQDGIADALGLDDGYFVPTYQIGDPVKGGMVIVEIGA